MDDQNGNPLPVTEQFLMSQDYLTLCNIIYTQGKTWSFRQWLYFCDFNKCRIQGVGDDEGKTLWWELASATCHNQWLGLNQVWNKWADFISWSDLMARPRKGRSSHICVLDLLFIAVYLNQPLMRGVIETLVQRLDLLYQMSPAEKDFFRSQLKKCEQGWATEVLREFEKNCFFLLLSAAIEVLQIKGYLEPIHLQTLQYSARCALASGYQSALEDLAKFRQKHYEIAKHNFSYILGCADATLRKYGQLNEEQAHSVNYYTEAALAGGYQEAVSLLENLIKKYEAPVSKNLSTTLFLEENDAVELIFSQQIGTQIEPPLEAIVQSPPAKKKKTMMSFK